MKINQDNRVVPIKQVKPNKYNPKKHYDTTPEGKQQFARILKSMKQHGQIDPLLCRELKDGTFEIVNGFHRYKAATKLGFKEVEIKNLGKLSDAKAKAIALATEDSKVPLDKLGVAKIVHELLIEDESLLEDIPYSEEDAEELKKLAEFDFDAYEGKEEDEDLEDDEPKAYKVTIPNDKLEAWKAIKRNRNIDDDMELIVLLIDENSQEEA